MVRPNAVLAGRYRLEELLGRGGMGQVWRGVDLRLGRPVAVKVLVLPVAAEPVAVARFQREAEVAATLTHPGITTVFDIDEHREGDERWLFLVMELLVGRDLRHLLAAHPGGLPVERVGELGVQVADALAAAHGGGVVHRDIKPANLFLLETGQVKICDFGIARLADATKITATGSTAGTPLYMAPEQIQAGLVDHRTDLYAFGCVLFEMLTGSTWVDAGSNAGAIIYQHLSRSPAPPRSVRAEVPADLDSLVLELLAKRPEDRPSDARFVAERLRRLSGEPYQAPGGGPSPGGVSDGSGATAAEPTARLGGPPDAPPPAPTAPTSALTSSPIPRRIGRRTVVLGGLGAAALLGTGLLVLDTDPPLYTCHATLTGHTDEITAVAFSPDGKTLATASFDGTARLWDLATGHSTGTITVNTAAAGVVEVFSVAFSPDGNTLATGSDDDTARLWDAATGHTTATLTGHTNSVYSVAFSPDGKTLATGSVDNTARLWKVK